jgi:HK97 family phage portal protein
VPRVFNAPYGGATYFGQAYKWQEAISMYFWVGVAIKAWMAEVAGGEGPKLGNLTPKDEGEQKVLRKCKSLGMDNRKSYAELHRHRNQQQQYRGLRKKALGGPREHEEFEAWDDDHPIVRLFNLPNLLDCSYDLWAFTTMFFKLTGEAHWWVMRNAFGVPVEVWVIPTHWMRLVTGRDGMPEAYAIQSPWGTLQYAPYDDVLSFYDHSPLNRYEGWGVPLMINEWIDTYNAHVRARLAQYKNGAIPTFHVALSEDYVDPDESMLNRYYSKWFGRFQGEDNTGKPLITGPGVEVKPLGLSPVDMQYVENEKQLRENILAAFGVPPELLGLDQGGNVSDYAPLRSFCRYHINPFLGFLSQRITHGLIRRTPNCETGICFWDDRVLYSEENTRADIALAMANGLRSPNEARTMQNQEPYPFGGDDPIVNGQILPWVTGEKQQDDAELDQAMQRASGGQIALNPNPEDDDPLIVDKDEDQDAGPLLRWFKTRDGHQEAHGQSGRWFIERTPEGYVLHKDGTHFNESQACGLLKKFAEDEENKAIGGSVGTGTASPTPSAPKAMGEGSGAAGGYTVPVEQLETRNFGQRYVPNSTAHSGHSALDGADVLPPTGVSIEDRRRVQQDVRELLSKRFKGLLRPSTNGNGRVH